LAVGRWACRRLHVRHGKVGEVLRVQGDAPAALAECRKGMAIAALVAASDPARAEWLRGLIVNRIKSLTASSVPKLHQACRSGPADATPNLTPALAVASALAESGRLAPVDAWMIPGLERRLRDLGAPPP
jgi:hypothetical protein